MMIFNLEEIKKAQKHISVLVEELKSGYVKYSTGQTTVPPVGHLDFENPTGNTFIKFGHVHGDPSFVIKLFTSLYNLLLASSKVRSLTLKGVPYLIVKFLLLNL